MKMPKDLTDPFAVFSSFFMSFMPFMVALDPTWPRFAAEAQA